MLTMTFKINKNRILKFWLLKRKVLIFNLFILKDYIS